MCPYTAQLTNEMSGKLDLDACMTQGESILMYLRSKYDTLSEPLKKLLHDPSTATPPVHVEQALHDNDDSKEEEIVLARPVEGQFSLDDDDIPEIE